MCTALIGYIAVLFAIIQSIALTLKEKSFKARVVPNFSVSWVSTSQVKSIDVKFDCLIVLSLI